MRFIHTKNIKEAPEKKGALDGLSFDSFSKQLFVQSSEAPIVISFNTSIILFFIAVVLGFYSSFSVP